MTKELKSDRWTCPNDRNLQLRSKLNAGWSYHTGKKTIKKDPQLTESELIEIQKVLQRSEMVERNEKERVLKLVERLENMKRNASRAGCPSPNRCALCGDYFCLLRSVPNQCGFCHKILCTKCCIDTQYTVDDDSTGGSMQSRRNSTSNISMSSTKVVVYLCRLCSEQREFLKKSGAWFLKKYPNYVKSSGEKFSSTSNLSSTEASSPKKLSFSSVPMQIKRTISSSSSNISSFKFWKSKETSNQAYFNNNDVDNVSDISIDNDLQHESYSNCDSNSLTNRTASSENINLKTPNSPNKKQENFIYSNSPISNNGNHLSIAKNQYFSNNSNNNNINYNNLNDSANQNSNPLKSTSTNSIRTTNSVILGNNSDNEDDTSPNMSSYNYYSNIINNMKTNSSANLNPETQMSNSNQNSTQNTINKSNSVNKSSTFKLATSNNNSTNNANSLASNYSNASTTSDYFSKNFSTNNALNGMDSLSSSGSSLSSNQIKSFPSNSNISAKSETNKSFKKAKVVEWCSTQLSMDKEEMEDDRKKKASLKLPKNKNQTTASNGSLNSHNYMNGNNSSSKISSQLVNNLANKIVNQNSSALPVGSIAAPSSSAVLGTASFLATSLNKLNIN